MQCAYAVLLFVACPALQYFSHYLINDPIFGEKNVIEHEMCVVIFSTTLSGTVLIP